MSKKSSFRCQLLPLMLLLMFSSPHQLVVVQAVAASPSSIGEENDVATKPTNVRIDGKLRTLEKSQCSIDQCNSNSANARLNCCEGFVCTTTIDIHPGRCVEAVVGCTESWCYDTLTEALDAGHGSIFILNGIHRLDTTIQIMRPYVQIVGESKEGTVLLYEGINTMIQIVDTHDVSVSSLTLDAKTNDYDGHRIWEAFGVTNSYYVSLTDSIIYGSTQMFAVFFSGPTNHYEAGQETIDAFNQNHLDKYNKVEGNTIYQYSTLDVLSFSLQQYGRVKDNLVVGGTISFFMNKQSDCSDNTIVDSMTNGVFLSVPAEDNRIERNRIFNSRNAGIKVARQVDHLGILDSDTGEYGSLTPTTYRAPGMILADNHVYGSSYFGLEIQNTVDAKIESNVVSNTALSAVYSLYNTDMSLENNEFAHFGRNCTDSTWSRFNAAMFGDYKTSGSRIANNVIFSSDGDEVWGEKCAKYAIFINGGADQSGNVVSKNIVSGTYLGDPFSVSPGDNVVENNMILVGT